MIVKTNFNALPTFLFQAGVLFVTSWKSARATRAEWIYTHTTLGEEGLL